MGKRTVISKGITFASKEELSESDVDIDANEPEDEESVEVEELPQVKRSKRSKVDALAEVEANDEDQAEVRRKDKKKRKKDALAEVEGAEVEVEVSKKDKKGKKSKVSAEDDKEVVASNVATDKEEMRRKRREAFALAEAEQAKTEEVVKKHAEVQRAEVEVSNERQQKELTLFVSGIPWDVNERTFREDFSKGGTITKFNAPMNDQGKPRGIAFITYKTKRGVDEALKLNGVEYGGRTLSVKLADKPKEGKGKGKDKGKDKGKGKSKGDASLEVWVCGLPFETERDILRKDFEECGEISSLNMLSKADGSCRGVAFITYKTMEAVEKACEFNGTEYGGRWIQVEKSGHSKGAGKSKGNGSKQADDGESTHDKTQDVGGGSAAAAPSKTFDSDEE